MWRETLADDPATEKDTRQGGHIPTEINPRLLHDIQALLSRLVGKAKQLLGNHTTNLAECWMYIKSKFDGGKVVNRSQSGSWEHRCMGAGLQQNMGKTWGPTAWSKMTNTSPNQVFLDAAESSAKKADNDRKRKATEEAKEQRRKSKYTKVDNTAAARKAYTRHNDGIAPDDVSDDITPDYLEYMKMSFYNTKVVVTNEECKDIEKTTRQQSENEKWMIERRKRITASRVGGIAKMRNTTKRSKKVQEMLYSTFRGNVATRYGTEMEEIAKNEYATHQQQTGHTDLEVESCGLSVALETPWLAASPDGVVRDPNNVTHPTGLVEIKNPYSTRQLTLTEACNSSTFCLEQKQRDGQVAYRLKRKHDYYYQVQCQLYCADKAWCDFVLRTEKELHVERVYRDHSWWSEQIPKLKIFYALLPELACPRHRKGGIREAITHS